MQHIVPLDHGEAVHLESVGSKAFHLMEMKKNGFHIPNGFVLTSEAFRLFLSENEITDDLSQLIFQFYSGLTEREKMYAVAVRSSSALEDLENASFAGQYETILNIRTFEQCLESIKRCWSSFFSPTVREYAKQKSIEFSSYPMGVLVQGMVDADVSGVIFSKNPITQNDSEVVINASYGLGESVVSGIVTPDFFIVDKENNCIQKELGFKEIMIVPAEYGTETVETPEAKQNEFCLLDGEIRALADLTRKIEAYYQYPVDIEFALKNGEIYLLQVRPITA